MKALLVEKPPTEPGWSFDLQWNGCRAPAVMQNGKVRLFSRRARDITTEFPEVADAVAEIPAEQFVIDGEIVASSEQGVARFQWLRNYRQQRASGAARIVCYYVFDLLNLEGRDLKPLPLRPRKTLLKDLVARQPDPSAFPPGLPATRRCCSNARRRSTSRASLPSAAMPPTSPAAAAGND